MSDPAPDPNPQDALNALAPDARAAYELTGEFPQAEAPKSEPEPEPDPDETPEPEPAAEAAPVVPERKISKRQEHLNNLERRAAEAEAARAELAARLAAVEARTKPAEEPTPAAAEPVVDPNDPEPQEADFETYGQFTRAVAQWAIRQDRREAEAAAAKTKAAEAETQQRESFRTMRETWIGRRNAFTAKHPAKAERLLSFLDHVHAGTPVGDTIMESEVGAELADYLAEHPDEAERIARLAPVSALRALGKLEASLEPTHASAPAQPAAKTVTTAPAIPHTLAARSADPADPVRAAVERGDYSAFEAEANRLAAL